jgi:hypothetical protein
MLLKKTADALGMAQKLSHQLRSAEDRIAELEAEVTQRTATEPSAQSNGSIACTRQMVGAFLYRVSYRPFLAIFSAEDCHLSRGTGRRSAGQVLWDGRQAPHSRRRLGLRRVWKSIPLL